MAAKSMQHYQEVAERMVRVAVVLIVWGIVWLLK